jgi:hypothetical protein
MTEQISYKQFFKNYLILIGVMLVVFTLLIYLSIVSKKSWNNNLKTAVEVVLDEKQPNTWSVGKNIEINNPFTMSGACYEARNRKNGEVYKVMVIRVVTNYGPMAGVFSVDKVNNVDFIGFSNLHGRIEKQVSSMSTSTCKQISYWKNKIPQILGNK